MSRTLADMTPEERKACVGRWCDNLASTAQEPAPVVLECVQGKLCWVLHIDLHGERSCFSLGSVAPRLDLMRAWNPDGTPVKMIEETIKRVDDTNPDVYALKPHRRFVSEWEATDE